MGCQKALLNREFVLIISRSVAVQFLWQSLIIARLLIESIILYFCINLYILAYEKNIYFCWFLKFNGSHIEINMFSILFEE